MIGGIGLQEILIILAVGAAIFGVVRVPKIARSIGAGMREFKHLKKGLKFDFEDNNAPAQGPHSDPAYNPRDQNEEGVNNHTGDNGQNTAGTDQHQ